MKKFLLPLLTIAILYGIGRFIVVAYDSAESVAREPYLQKLTNNSVQIRWNTPKRERGCLRYGAGTLRTKVCETRKTKRHLLTLSNLQEGTTYRYRVISDSLRIDNDGRKFTTLTTDTDKPLRIWVIGDSGKSGKKQKNVYKAMRKRLGSETLDMWLLLGDNAYRSGTQKQFNKGLFIPYKRLVKELAPITVMGNHDARRWAQNMIFHPPKSGECGGVASHDSRFYAIDNASLHLVVIDSEHAPLGKNGALAKWLDEDLKQNKKRWSIVALHHPPYSDGSHNSDSDRRMRAIRQNIVPILERHGVDLVLSGHSHAYERSFLLHKHYGLSHTFNTKKHLKSASRSNYEKSISPRPFNGTIYLVIGSSSKLDRARLKHPAMAAAYAKLGSVLISVNKSRLSGEFIDDRGNVVDKFSIVKK